MKSITYTERRMLVEQGRALKRVEAALQNLKREWEKLQRLTTDVERGRGPEGKEERAS